MASDECDGDLGHEVVFVDAGEVSELQQRLTERILAKTIRLIKVPMMQKTFTVFLFFKIKDRDT